MTASPHRIVVVGGGSGGLKLAARLGDHYRKDPGIEVTLIDGNLTHVWKPLLHEIAAGTLDVDDDECEYMAHARAHHFRFTWGRMEGLDRSARQVIDNRLSHRVQQTPGVAQIDLWGGPEREIQVRLRPERVQALDVPLAEVVDALRQSNLDRPGGSIERGNTEFTVRVPGRYTNLDDIREGSPVEVGQIAEVRDTQNRVTRIIRINGEPGIRMAVRKQSGAKTVEVARRLHEEIDRSRAADQGVRLADVATTVETALAGRVASRLLDEGDETDIRVQMLGSETLTPAALRDLRVPAADGSLVRLSNMARVVRATGPAVIERKNQARIIEVEANLVGRDMGSVVDDVQAALAEMPVPDNYDVALCGDYEEQQSAFVSLFLSLGLAVALVYMVMASLYESLRDPLIIMGSVPLALISVVVALLVTGMTLNAQSLIGCVILVGIVVNNAILIVDQSNRLRGQGLTLRTAIHEAGRRRLRPIMMTALTTTLALLPLAIGTGEGGETQAPMGRAVIGGLLASTLITLVLIPVIYERIHRNNPAPATPR